MIKKYAFRFRTLLILNTLIIAACSGSNESGESPISSKSSSGTVFREHKVTDPGMNNIVATTFLVPEGWNIEGGMTRPSPQYFSIAYMLDLAFAAPDGRQVHFFSFLVV